MHATQISIFLENKSGRLAYVTGVLKDLGISIRALCVADTSDFGILRIIVDQPQRAYDALKAADVTVSITEVVATSIPDEPGALHNVLRIFGENAINLEYLYAYCAKSGSNAVTVFRVENADKAAEVLANNNIKTLNDEELMEL